MCIVGLSSGPGLECSILEHGIGIPKGHTAGKVIITSGLLGQPSHHLTCLVIVFAVVHQGRGFCLAAQC